jgi:hypothetical protein
MVNPTLLALSLLLPAAPAFADSLPIACVADFSAFGRNLSVRIEKTPAGALASSINGAPYNADVKTKEFSVRPNLDLDADPYSNDYNFAEKALVHIQGLRKEPSVAAEMRIPFDLATVRKARVYLLDADSETNKFGGTVLIEALAADGRSMGRVLRSVFVNGCF